MALYCVVQQNNMNERATQKYINFWITVCSFISSSDIFGSWSDKSMWNKLKFRLIKLDTKRPINQFTILPFLLFLAFLRVCRFLYFLVVDCKVVEFGSRYSVRQLLTICLAEYRKKTQMHGILRTPFQKAKLSVTEPSDLQDIESSTSWETVSSPDAWRKS